MSILTSVEARRSHPRVTADAPTHAELLPLVAAAATVADHGALRPWRLIEVRGAARERLGDALVEASGLDDENAERLRAKPLRASLLLALVVVRKHSFKVHDWEQDVAAAGVGHVLSLLLAEAGWGVMWRTGGHTRTESVRRVHELADNEELLGWLYVGGITDEPKTASRSHLDPESVLSVL